VIQLKNINFCYAGGENAGRLEQINLEIPDGQVVLLCGRSGCGKTTLTRLVNGLIPNYYEGELTGEVLLDGKNISRLPLYETAKYVGSVFQNPRTQFFTVDSTSELPLGVRIRDYPKARLPIGLSPPPYSSTWKISWGKIFFACQAEKNKKLPALLFLSAISLLSF